MGLCIGSLGSSIACCFGNAFCSLCCSSCPSCKGSTSTRIAYGLILFAGLITSYIMLIPDVENALKKNSIICGNSSSNNGSTSSNICSHLVGSVAVYHLSLGMTIFFSILSLLVSLFIYK
jgi:uncharacterized membrane protein YuzA (DUF378 family)